MGRKKPKAELIPLPQEKIEEIFERAENQAEYTLDLYRIAFPRWESIEKVEGWPKVSPSTSDFIFRHAVEFDSIFHPGFFLGELWVNRGFSFKKEVPDWMISLDGVTVHYKE